MTNFVCKSAVSLQLMSSTYFDVVCMPIRSHALINVRYMLGLRCGICCAYPAYVVRMSGVWVTYMLYARIC